MVAAHVIALVAGLLAAFSADSSAASKDDFGNKFIVTFSVFPDPFHYFSFFDMPRTVNEALQSSFSLASNNSNSRRDFTTLYCRKNDYRVCVLFDQQGSVAGIQVSAAVDEIEKTKIPMDLNRAKYWFRHEVLGVEVFSTITYFVSEEVLVSGGRPITANTPTAPDGIFLGDQVRRVHVPPFQNKVEEVGFVKQGCYKGMGMHYFQELNATSRCEDHKPYFLLFSPQSFDKPMLGFGIAQFGDVSNGRGFLSGWFEHPPASIIPVIAPNSPVCLQEWFSKYHPFTIHVYFVDKPKEIRC